YANLASFPATGETGKIYVAIDTAYQYRWSGSAYVNLSTTSFYTKTEVDNKDATKLSLAGGTMTGDIVMTSKTIYPLNVATTYISSPDGNAKMTYVNGASVQVNQDLDTTVYNMLTNVVKASEIRTRSNEQRLAFPSGSYIVSYGAHNFNE